MKSITWAGMDEPTKTSFQKVLAISARYPNGFRTLEDIQAFVLDGYAYIESFPLTHKDDER